MITFRIAASLLRNGFAPLDQVTVLRFQYASANPTFCFLLGFSCEFCRTGSPLIYPYLLLPVTQNRAIVKNLTFT